MREYTNKFQFFVFLALIVALATAIVPPSRANDLPLAAGSPLAGFSFDDRPLLLPVQRNFQMGMLTASSEIGRSCGKMESYGWRMNSAEQERVNIIFNNTVDRLRALGYVVETQAPNSVSHDVTLFTADRSDKHFIFMWSAGEIGLVMVLCESSPSLTGRMAETLRKTQSVQTFPSPDVLEDKLALPQKNKMAYAAREEKFSPVGNWVGEYSCAQGETGATLHISKVVGENFDGVFHFYPNEKSHNVPRGSYAVSGQYDWESHRILINPGKWLVRPKDFYNTIIVGSFDPLARTFSGFFQGIMGCTSMEAKYAGRGSDSYVEKTTSKKAKNKTKSKAVKKKTVKTAPPATAPEIPPSTEGIKLPDANAGSATSSEPTAVVPTAPITPTNITPESAAVATPAVPLAPPAAADTVALPPKPTEPVITAPSLQAPSPAPTTTPASVTEAPPAPTPALVTPPPVAPQSAPPTAAPEPLKPTSLLHEKYIVVASGETFNTTVPKLPPAQNLTTSVPTVPTPPHLSDTVEQVRRPAALHLPAQAPQPNYVSPHVPEIPDPTQIQAAPTISQPSHLNPSIPEVPEPPQLRKPDYMPVPPVSNYH
jgi:hypothetical protein